MTELNVLGDAFCGLCGITVEAGISEIYWNQKLTAAAPAAAEAFVAGFWKPAAGVVGAASPCLLVEHIGHAILVGPQRTPNFCKASFGLAYNHALFNPARLLKGFPEKKELSIFELAELFP